MKKWSLIVVLLLTLGVASGMATTIDFSSAGGCVYGSIATTLGLDCGGVNFSYADGGNNTAQLTNAGILVNAGGDAGIHGTLNFAFLTQTQSVSFDFVITPAAALGADGYGFLVALNNNLDGTATDATGVGTVSFLPAAAPFTVMNVDTNPLATQYTIGALSYEAFVAPAVPEPGTYAMFGSGLLLLGFGSRKLIRRKS